MFQLPPEAGLMVRKILLSAVGRLGLAPTGGSPATWAGCLAGGGGFAGAGADDREWGAKARARATSPTPAAATANISPRGRRQASWPELGSSRSRSTIRGGRASAGSNSPIGR